MDSPALDRQVPDRQAQQNQTQQSQAQKSPVLDSHALALLAADACDDRKAVDIVMIRVDEVSSLADWFVIASGLSDVQVRAIARSVEDRLETEAGRMPLRKEGQSEGRWVLLDYGEVIVHALTPAERRYYDLEAFWGHGETVPFLGSEPVNLGSGQALAG